MSNEAERASYESVKTLHAGEIGEGGESTESFNVKTNLMILYDFYLLNVYYHKQHHHSNNDNQGQLLRLQQPSPRPYQAQQLPELSLSSIMTMINWIMDLICRIDHEKVFNMFWSTWSKLTPGARRLSRIGGRWGSASVLLGKLINTIKYLLRWKIW